MENKIIAKSFPEAVAIGLTKKCNLSCLMCPYKESKDDIIMSLYLFRKVEKEILPYIYNVCLCGAGECLLHPHFPKILKVLKTYNFKWGWHLITNGLLIDDEIAEAIVANNSKEVIISVDGANEDTYRRVRAFGKSDGNDISLSKVLSNIDKINYFKKEFGTEKPEILFNFVVMDFNIYELPLVVEIAYDHNVNCIQLVRMASGQDDTWRKYSIDLKSPKCSEIIGNAQSLARELGIKISFEYTEGFVNKGEPCPIPWKWANIAADGEFIPCSWIEKKYDGFEVGNLNEQSFMEIWNNEKMRELRSSILDGTYSFCKKYASPNCTHLIAHKQ